MAVTTGDHTLTFPGQSAATPWTSTFTTFAQGISNHLDNLADVQINNIVDSSDNWMLRFTAVGSAVNFIGMTNAATNTSVIMTSAGSDTNVDFTITAKGSGQVVLDGTTLPTSDGTSGQGLSTDGSNNLSFTTLLDNVVEDTTPQLGGALDVNGKEITGAIDLHSTGDIILELGDASGTNKVSIRDSAAAETASINSDGDLACTDIIANSLVVTTAITATSFDINGATAISTTANSDRLLAYDTSASTNKKGRKDTIVTSPWTFLSKQSPSGSSAQDVELDTGYDIYMIHIYGLKPETEGVELKLRVYSGGAEKSGSSDYQWASLGLQSDAGAQADQSSGDSAVDLIDAVGSGGVFDGENANASLKIFIFNARNTGVETSSWSECCYLSNDGAVNIQNNCWERTSAEDNEKFKIYFASGDITEGTILTYGLTL